MFVQIIFLVAFKNSLRRQVEIIKEFFVFLFLKFSRSKILDLKFLGRFSMNYARKL